MAAPFPTHRTNFQGPPPQQQQPQFRQEQHQPRYQETPYSTQYQQPPPPSAHGAPAEYVPHAAARMKHRGQSASAPGVGGPPRSLALVQQESERYLLEMEGLV